MPTYCFENDKTGERYEVVMKITAEMPQTLGELFKVMRRKLKKKEDPNQSITKIINAEGGFSIYGKGVYRQGFVGGNASGKKKGRVKVDMEEEE